VRAQGWAVVGAMHYQSGGDLHVPLSKRVKEQQRRIHTQLQVMSQARHCIFTSS